MPKPKFSPNPRTFKRNIRVVCCSRFIFDCVSWQMPRAHKYRSQDQSTCAGCFAHKVHICTTPVKRCYAYAYTGWRIILQERKVRPRYLTRRRCCILALILWSDLKWHPFYSSAGTTQQEDLSAQQPPQCIRCTQNRPCISHIANLSQPPHAQSTTKVCSCACACSLAGFRTVFLSRARGRRRVFHRGSLGLWRSGVWCL